MMKHKILLSLCALSTLISCYEPYDDAGYDYTDGDIVTIVPSISVSGIDSVHFFKGDVDINKDTTTTSYFIGAEYEMPFVHEYRISNEKTRMICFSYLMYKSGGNVIQGKPVYYSIRP